MFDPESNLAEQLAYALRHHQKNQQNLKSTKDEIEKLREMLQKFDDGAAETNEESR